MNTNNLEALLSNVKFQQGARMKEVFSLKKESEDADLTKFESTLKMAKHVANALEYFKGTECKELMKECNVTLTQDEFGKHVFGFQRSWVGDLKNASKLEHEIIEAYKVHAQEKGSYSIKDLLKFAKNEGIASEGENEIEGAETKKESFSMRFTKGKLVIKGEGQLTLSMCTLLIEEIKRIQQSAKA